MLSLALADVCSLFGHVYVQVCDFFWLLSKAVLTAQEKFVKPLGLLGSPGKCQEEDHAVYNMSRNTQQQMAPHKWHYNERHLPVAM